MAEEERGLTWAKHVHFRLMVGKIFRIFN